MALTLSLLTVFGNDNNTPDGTCIRDYVYVCVLAEAPMVGLQRLMNQDGVTEELVHLGTRKVSV